MAKALQIPSWKQLRLGQNNELGYYINIAYKVLELIRVLSSLQNESMKDRLIRCLNYAI